MQTHMGGFIEKNMHMLKDMVGQYNAHVSPLSGTAAKPFAGMQPPAVQQMISGYMEQSQKAVAQLQTQMQENMKRHTEQMLTAMGLKR